MLFYLVYSDYCITLGKCAYSKRKWTLQIPDSGHREVTRGVDTHMTIRGALHMEGLCGRSCFARMESILYTNSQARC